MSKKIDRSVFVLAILAACNGSAAILPPPGIDCDCDAAGNYSPPSEPVALYLGPNGESADGHYIATLRQSFPNFDLEVKRVVDERIVVVVANLPQNTAYGFSPNRQSFAYFSIRNQGGDPGTASELAAVYDLAAANTPPVRPVWSFEKLGLASAGYGFSPYGRYFVFTIVNGPTTSLLKVIDTSTGRSQLDTVLNFFDAPIINLQLAGWGFSPDTEDRSFVYTHAVEQLTASLNIINLNSKQNVLSRTLHGTASWRFSPCGDVFGLMVPNNLNGTDLSLFHTLNGTSLFGAARTISRLNVALSVNAASHIATAGSDVSVLASNTASIPCANDTIWVDFAYVGHEIGTFEAPFTTLAKGIFTVPGDGRVIIKAGSLAETLTITKPVTVESFGGVATIGQ